MTAERLDGHLAVPAGAHELREAERVVLVGLVDLNGKSRLGMTRVHADDRHPEFAQRVPQPGRERSGLQADSYGIRCAATDDLGDRARISAHLSAPDLATGFIDHADRGILLRHIQTNELRHDGS